MPLCVRSFSRLVPHGGRVFVLSTALLLASCGAPAHSTSAEMTEAEVACVDFYRSVEESTEEEATYMRVLADRIAEAGHPEAAAVLSDLADQWEVGVWEGEQDEVWQSGLWAKYPAGRVTFVPSCSAWDHSSSQLPSE